MAKQAASKGIAVMCAFTRMASIDTLKPHPANPNTHSESQIRLLAKVIAAQGWRSPIVVSKLSGYITKGHARFAAAKLLKLKSVPVDNQNYTDKNHELSDMVADNRLAELSDMDMAMLKDILQDLDTGAFDMDITGFDSMALEELMTRSAPPKDKSQGDSAGTGAGVPDGSSVSDGRFILLFATDTEKEVWMSKLGIDGQKIVYTIDDIAD